MLPLATASGKKRRRSGFRYSSRKALSRSRLSRQAKARGCDVTSVTRTLSYPSLNPSERSSGDIEGGGAATSGSPCLESIAELTEDCKGISNKVQINTSEYPNSVSNSDSIIREIY